MVVIGHSMGGILSRLMVSSSGDVLWKALQEYRSFTPEEMAEAEAEFGDMMRFEPFHGITRAVFIATPHRGTEFAEHRLARWASNLITLPATVLRKFARMSQRAEGGEMPGGEPYYIPNGVDSLSPKDPFIRLLPQMPISPAVTFHSIVATDKPDAPLEESTDGFVTYHSAHLDGAASEAVIPYTHSVQEAPEAILEIRRRSCASIWGGEVGTCRNRGGCLEALEVYRQVRPWPGSESVLRRMFPGAMHAESYERETRTGRLILGHAPRKGEPARVCDADHQCAGYE